MSKLVSQLRALAGMASSKHGDILKHAANEIERLTFLVTILIPGPGNRGTAPPPKDVVQLNNTKPPED